MRKGLLGESPEERLETSSIYSQLKKMHNFISAFEMKRLKKVAFKGIKKTK